MDQWQALIPEALLNKYEIHNFNHAAEILSQAYKNEFIELISVLEAFHISVSDLMVGGGNESAIPKKFSALLRPLGWQEVKISGNLQVNLRKRNPSTSPDQFVIEDFIDGHNIDYVKGRVAFDMEWNSKDQTFDRDLYAFRAFYECGVISCGVIVTRSEKLNPVFNQLGIKKKYGASTTWIGKLLPRISSGRSGGCPLLVFGILPSAIVNLEES